MTTRGRSKNEVRPLALQVSWQPGESHDSGLIRLTVSDEDRYAGSWSAQGVLAFVDGLDDIWVWVVNIDLASDVRRKLATKRARRPPNCRASTRISNG